MARVRRDERAIQGTPPQARLRVRRRLAKIVQHDGLRIHGRIDAPDRRRTEQQARLVGRRQRLQPHGRENQVVPGELPAESRLQGDGSEDQPRLLDGAVQADGWRYVEMHAVVVDGAAAGLPVGLEVVARTALAADRGVQGRERVLGIDVDAIGDVGHHVDVELVVARVACDGRADGEAALRIEVADGSRQRAVLAIQPFVDGVIVVDGELVVGRAELDPDRDVRQFTSTVE